MSGIVPRETFYQEEKPPLLGECPHCLKCFALKFERYEEKRSIYVCKICKKETTVSGLPPHDLL
jgi:hypothetical protein